MACRKLNNLFRILLLLYREVSCHANLDCVIYIWTLFFFFWYIINFLSVNNMIFNPGAADFYFWIKFLYMEITNSKKPATEKVKFKLELLYMKTFLSTLRSSYTKDRSVLLYGIQIKKIIILTLFLPLVAILVLPYSLSLVLLLRFTSIFFSFLFLLPVSHTTTYC